jgi:hypothetical protein
MMFASRAALVATPPPLPATTYVRGPRDAAPSRRCSADGCVPTTTVSSGHSADPPWALVPFEVLRPRDCSRGGCFVHAVHQHPSDTISFIVRRRARPFGQRVAPFRPRFLVAHSPAFRLGIPTPAMVARGSSRHLLFRQLTDRDEAGSSWYCYWLNEHRRVFPPSVPGSSDASAFRRLLLGSCEDPSVTPCGASARLPTGPVPLREQDNQKASSHLRFRLGDLKEYADGTVGLDPSRACVRPSLFTMFDHGWPPLPMTRP